MLLRSERVDRHTELRVKKLDIFISSLCAMAEDRHPPIEGLFKNESSTLLAFIYTTETLSIEEPSTTSCQLTNFERDLRKLQQATCAYVLELFICNTASVTDILTEQLRRLVRVHGSIPPNMSCAKHSSKPGSSGKADQASHKVYHSEQLPWAGSLQEMITTKAEQDAAFLHAAIHRVCAQLEERCDKVELPLRAEKSRCEDLESKYAELEEAYGKLESSLIDRDLQISDADDREQRVATELEAIRQDHSVTLKQVDCLLQQLADQGALLAQAKLDADSVRCSVVVEQERRMAETEALNEEHSQELSRLKVQLEQESIKARQATDTTEARQREKVALEEHLDKQEKESQALHARMQAVEQERSMLEQENGEQRALLESLERSKEILEQSTEKLRHTLAEEKSTIVAELQETACQARREVGLRCHAREI